MYTPARHTIILFFLQPWFLIAANIPQIDPGLIPDVQENLAILNSPEYADVLVNKVDNRPQKCPLRSETKLSGIQEQLQTIATALKYGECYDKNREIIDGFESLLSQDNQIFARLPWNDENPPTGEAAAQENQAMTRRQQIFSVLKTVSSDDACLYNVRKRGLLPVVADVVTNIGQVSTLIPTMNGFYLSASAVSLGAALKIIVSIFGSRFNWEDANERKQFLQLNCNFFDLRRELEAAEVVEIRDAQIPDKISRSREVKDALSNHMNQLKIRRKAILAEINQIKNEYLMSVLPEGTMPTFISINSIQNAVPVIKLSNPQEKIDTIQKYSSQSNELVRLIADYNFNPPYKPLLLELLGKMSWENLQSNIAEDTEELQQNTLEPILYYLNKYHKMLSEIIEQKNRLFLAFKSQGMLSNGEIIDRLEDNYERIFFEFLKSISFIDTRIEILSSKDPKLSLDAFDDGAHTIYDILENYHYIQSLLIGKLGYSYLNYFREKINAGLISFKKTLRVFNKKYIKKRPKGGEYNELWPCRDANQLRVQWEKLNSATEVANDFIQTNSGIFRSNVRKFDTFLKFFPVRISREMAMFKYVKSAEYATKMINGEIPVDKKKLKKIEFSHNFNLGLLFIKRRELQGERNKIEKFWQQRDCQSNL